MSNILKVATGIKTGADANPALVSTAIQSALEKAGVQTAGSVLLFLTSEFATTPQLAIKAAAIAASTTQVIGCSATGIFTEDEWVLDGAAAAAMIFSEDIFSSLSEAVQPSEYLLTLAAPSALNANWLNSKQKRFGGISGDATGRGPFSVWHNGKGTTQGYCEFGIHHCQVAVAASHGLKLISSPRKVTSSQHLDLIHVAHIPALTSIQSACQRQNVAIDDLPYHLLMIAYAKTAHALEQGEYALASIVMTDDEANTITLSHPIAQGSWICWALRDTTTAKAEMLNTAQQLQQQLHQNPAFALMFSCIGRGPYFYNGNDQDLAAVKTIFPKLPIIGFYGNGEIAPILGTNTLLQYSAVLGLFAAQV
ncbi:MAG: FIST C-terminal domain-containing protein [Methylophilus sp.]|nr:FIST C-terminal domain-containing protein [Methylophilus sp.]